MLEEPGRPGPDRNATWVGLRTLRQRPTVVGRTEDGEVVYEIRSVQLLLTAGASHFCRLVHCSKCGRPVAGRPVLTSADLDRPSNPVFCNRCAATTPSTQAPAAPAPPVVTAARVVVPKPAPQPPDRARTAAAAPGRRDVPAVERSEVVALSAALTAVRSELRELAGTQAQLGEQVRAVAARAEEQPAGLAAIAGAIDELQRRLDAGTTRDDAIEGRMGATADSLRAGLSELGQAQDELRQAVLAQSAVMPALPALVHDAVGEALQEVRAEISDLLHRVDNEQERIDARLHALRTELEHRVDEQSAAFEARLAAASTELGAAGQEAGEQMLEALAAPMRELARAHEELERRLAALATQLDEHASVQHALEQRVEAAAGELARLTEVIAGELPAPPARRSHALLRSLEEHLRAADERIAQSMSDAGGA